ncbi:MAG: prepilin-type N-terminal cleavage/methylation domain-containing protein [Acidobacteria bacterium]|nr:prepilin-type N-terminal cleavage/methylation domain-containing protein [Acidobacteriota bacterium]
MKIERGVTLLELLISISLVSLLSLGVLYSMRVGIDAMDKTNQRFMKNRRALGAEKVLAQQLAGLMPATVECGGPGAPKAPMFQGEPQTMRFVSSYSLAEGARGYPKLLEFTVIPGENNEGYRLIVAETPFASANSLRGLCVGIRADPLTGQPSPLFPPVLSRPDSFILADRMAAIRFVYRNEMPPPVFEQWFPAWQFGKWPSAVRIEMIPMQPDPANLHTGSVTIPIRLTANPYYVQTD